MSEGIGTCPWCGYLLIELGEIGIVDWDGRWEAQATRYICDTGHMVFVTLADPIEEAEEEYATEANNYE